MLISKNSTPYGMDKDIQKIRREVFVWKCSICGKEITSLYENQIDALVEQHKTNCKEKK